MVALLDVNVLIAQMDQVHQYHRTASQWWVQHQAAGWASCAITQNGCVRIVSQPSYANKQPMRAVLTQLRILTANSAHSFWPEGISLLDSSIFRHEHLHGPAQLTDAYLLAMAVKNKGRFVTLDRAIALNTVHGAKPSHIVVL